MPGTSETGHAKNVNNFEDLISFAMVMEQLTIQVKMH